MVTNLPTVKQNIALEEEAEVQLVEVATQHLNQERRFSDKQAWAQVGYLYTKPGSAFLATYASRAVAELGEADYVNHRDLSNQINGIYLPALESGHQVVLLAHSQGNYYANRAWNHIDNLANENIPSSQMGIVGSPANHVAGGGFHTTNNWDLVVDAVRAVSPASLQPLPANVFPGFHPIIDAKGHSLVDTYLGNTHYYSSVKAKIIEDINTTFEKLESQKECRSLILNKSVALHPQYPVARSKLDHLALSLEVT